MITLNCKYISKMKRQEKLKSNFNLIINRERFTVNCSNDIDRNEAPSSSIHFIFYAQIERKNRVIDQFLLTRPPLSTDLSIHSARFLFINLLAHKRYIYNYQRSSWKISWNTSPVHQTVAFSIPSKNWNNDMRKVKNNNSAIERKIRESQNRPDPLVPLCSIIARKQRRATTPLRFRISV